MKSKALIKILAITLVATLALCGCSKASDNTTTTEATTQATTVAQQDIVDENALNSLFNEYYITEASGETFGSYWALAIYYSEDEAQNILSLYDVVGNPGVRGEIVACSDSEIKVKVDYDYFEQLPSNDWVIENDEYLVMTYEVNENVISLTNNSITIDFAVELAE